MAEDRVTIDLATLLDNIGDRQVEFTGEASGERYDFAVQYDVLEALSTRIPDGDGAALVQLHEDEISRAAAKLMEKRPYVHDRIPSWLDAIPSMLLEHEAEKVAGGVPNEIDCADGAALDHLADLDALEEGLDRFGEAGGGQTVPRHRLAAWLSRASGICRARAR